MESCFLFVGRGSSERHGFLLFLAKDITFCQDLDGFLLGWVMFKREIGGPLLFWRRFVVEKVLISPDFLGALWVAL